MTHPNAEDLALLALGETLTPHQQSHLDDCPSCAAELMALQAAVRLGRSTAVEERLVPPAPRVWQALQDELGLQRPPVLAPRRPRRRRLVLTAVAAMLVGATAAVAASAVITSAGERAPEVLARTRLQAQPGWPTASGSAELERLADGRLVVHVDVTTPAVTGGYRELWLLGADSGTVSLGVVGQDDATYAVPADVDLSRFDVVDISREPPNGDPSHSTDSIARGRLRDVGSSGSDGGAA